MLDGMVHTSTKDGYHSPGWIDAALKFRFIVVGLVLESGISKSSLERSHSSLDPEVEMTEEVSEPSPVVECRVNRNQGNEGTAIELAYFRTRLLNMYSEWRN